MTGRTGTTDLAAAYDAVYAEKDVGLDLDESRWPRTRFEAAVALAGRGNRLLEIGCGDGEVLATLARRFHHVVGVELSPNRARNARRFLTQQIDVPFEIVEANVEAGLAFPDASFDSIIWADVIEHVLDVWAAMEEIARLLVPGGRLITVTPNIAGIRKRATLALGRFPSTSGRSEGVSVREGELFDGGHLHYFTYTSIEALYQRFAIEPIRRLGFGRFGRLHQLRPTLLSGSVAVVGTARGRSQ